MMRYFVSMMAILFVVGLHADDRGERVRLALHPEADARKARVALALAGPSAGTTGPCECHDTGICVCPDKPCDCCRRGLPSYGAQHAKALKEGRVLVGFLGCPGSCQADALCGVEVGRMDSVGVWVGYPKGGQMLVAAELPPGASAESIRAAIRRAQEMMRAADPCPGGFCPACRR